MKQRLRHVGLVFAKELKETLRDRRTLAVMILFPVVVYPLLSLLVGQVVLQRESRYEERAVRVGATAASPASLALQDPAAKAALRITWVPHAQAADVSARKLDVFVEQPPAQGPPPHPVKIVYDSSREDSSRAQGRVAQHLAAQLVPGSARQFAVVDADVGTPVARGGYLLSKVVPLLVVLMVILGAFYPAIDTTAGERERNTLETTLVAPVLRIDLLAGKVLSVATLALLSGLLNLGSLSLTFVQLAKTAAAGALPVPWGRLATATLVLPPAAIMFAAVMVMAATAAKSFKEAQNFLTPIYFAFFAPAVAATLGEFPNSVGWALVPGVNLTLITRDLILGEMQWLVLVCFVLSTIAVTIAALAVASHLFDSERLLAVATKHKRQRGAAPTSNVRSLDETDAAVGFAVALGLFFALAPLSRYNLLLGTLTSQWVGMLGFVLIYLRVRGLPPAATLRLVQPRAVHGVAALLLGGSAWMVVGVITQWLVPPSQDVIESLRGMLQAYPAPVAVLLFAITPAVCEEVLFRGLILRGMLGRFPPGISIITVSLLFGLFHFSADRLLPTASLGLLLGLAAWRSGSLWPSIVLHALNNGILVGLAWAGKDEAFDNLTGPTQMVALAAAVAALALGVGLLFRVPALRRGAQ